MWDKIKNKILDKIWLELEDHNRLYLVKTSTIAKDVYLRGVKISGDIDIGECCKISNGVTIEAYSKVKIDRYSSLNGPNLDINCKIHEVIIGAFTSIARNVSIQEFNHRHNLPASFHIFYNILDKDEFKDDFSKGPIIIGNDVWIGTHCVVLSGVTIGDGAIVGANSVVATKIPPYAIAVGSPAKVISYRFAPEIINLLLEIKWWNWPIEKIKRNEDFFSMTPSIESIKKII